jgi:hypothetical protein
MSEIDPTQFLDDLRAMIREKSDGPSGGTLVLNRAAIVLFIDGMKELDPTGFYQLPAVVNLGQRGQVGYLDGCAVYYDPAQDTPDGEPVARFLVED